MLQRIFALTLVPTLWLSADSAIAGSLFQEIIKGDFGNAEVKHLDGPNEPFTDPVQSYIPNNDMRIGTGGDNIRIIESRPFVNCKRPPFC